MKTKSTKLFTIRDITIIAALAAILFVQEEVLTFLPNIQLTVLLIVLYSKCLGFSKTTAIIIIHVILDNLIMGSFNLFYMPFMLVGWLMIPLLLCTVFKKISSTIPLALLGILFSLLYSWMFIIPGVLITKVNLIAYLSSDIPFELLLSASSFLSILLLYEPLKKVMDKMLHSHD